MNFKTESFIEIDVDQSLKERNLLSQDVDRIILGANGFIKAQGVNNKLFMRFNCDPSNYRSFVTIDGDNHGQEWDSRGLYIGRNNWGLDADFSFYLTVSNILKPGRKRITYGTSTFVHADGRVLGYTCHGLWFNTEDFVNKVTVVHYGASGALTKTFEKFTPVSEKATYL